MPDGGVVFNAGGKKQKDFTEEKQLKQEVFITRMVFCVTECAVTCVEYTDGYFCVTGDRVD